MHSQLSAVALFCLLLGAMQLRVSSSRVHSDIIDINATWFRYQVTEVPQAVIQVDYNLSFTEDKCCPGLYLTSLYTLYARKGCFIQSRFVYESIFLNQVRQLDQINQKSGCILEQGIFHCQGSINMQAHEPRNWTVFLGYGCDKKQALQFNFTLTVNSSDTYQCEPLYNLNCQKYYNMTTFPNYMALDTQKKAEEYYPRFKNLEIIKCHQNLDEAICRIIYTECRDGRPYVPCQSSCQEVMDACEPKLSSYLIPGIQCNQLPDSTDPEVCFHKPVVCPCLDAVSQGFVTISGTGVHSIASYDCGRGYHLEGAPNRTCQYSGEWTGDAPYCEPNPTWNRILLLIPVSFCAGLLLLLGTLLVVFRGNIKKFVCVKYQALKDCLWWDNYGIKDVAKNEMNI